MGLFNFLKPKKTIEESASDAIPKGPVAASGSYFETTISDADLRILINKVITVFQQSNGAGHNEVIDAIRRHRNEEDLAVALYRFIPIAWCRLFIPEPDYSDEYILVKEGQEQAVYLLSRDRVYNMVRTECKNRYEQAATQEEMLPILYHSADFNAINQALKGGSRLEDLVTVPSYFL